MQINPYLEFNGQCEAAFKFYEQSLGGKIVTMLNHADSPMADQTPSEWRNAILHARLEVESFVLMGSDTPPDHYKQPQGFSINLAFTKPEDAERVFKALAQNGTIRMPLQQTFWASRFGMLVDQFGIPWMVNCE